MCRQLGADLVYTEFVNAEGLLREDPEGPRRTARKLDFSDGERPLGIQIYGASERSMEEAARRATERHLCRHVDRVVAVAAGGIGGEHDQIAVRHATRTGRRDEAHAAVA